MALILLITFFITPVLMAADDHTHSHSAPSIPSRLETPPPPETLPQLTEEDRSEIESRLEACAKKPHTLASDKQPYCMSDNGIFKACDPSGKILQPEKQPPDPSSALILLKLIDKCAYCKTGGNASYNRSHCTQTTQDLISLQQIQAKNDQTAFEKNLQYYLKDIPEGLVALTKIGMQGYDIYQKIRDALQKLKDKKKKPPLPPPPGEEPIGADFPFGLGPMPPPTEGLAGGGPTQGANPLAPKQGGKFLGLNPKDSDRSSYPPSGQPPSAGGPTGSSGGGGSASVGGEAAGLGADRDKTSATNTADKTVTYSGSGSGFGGGSDALEKSLLQDLASEDNKIDSRLKNARQSEGDSQQATGKRTGIILLLERIRYTTEKTMGEIYIPEQQE